MRSLAITWTLRHHGWALVEVADDQGQAEVIASHVTDGPEQFLYAITRLVMGDADTRAELEGELRSTDGSSIGTEPRSTSAWSRPMTAGRRTVRGLSSGQVATRSRHWRGRPSAPSTGSRTSWVKSPAHLFGGARFPEPNSKPCAP